MVLYECFKIFEERGRIMRHERPLLELEIDAYRMPAKLSEPTICPSCGAVFTKGRWQLVTTIPLGFTQEHCPACKRIQDNYPEGYVTLEGYFFDGHSDEIISTIHNHEKHEQKVHPLKRIISIKS
jgi:hypothetical protein